MYGSVVPSLTRVMHLDHSGLYVPAGLARVTQPLDHMRVFITAEELVGFRMPISAIRHLLAEVPLEHALAWVSSLSAALTRPAGGAQGVELAFVEQHFNGDLKTKARNLLRDPRRVLLIPQALSVLTKLALVVCEPSLDPEREVELKPLITALLHIPSHLNASMDTMSDKDLVVGTDPGDLARYIIANQMFNATVDEKTSWAVFQRCWKELPVEMAGHPRMMDLPKVYEDVTGIPLGDLETLCSVLWARSMTGNATVTPDYFDSLGWTTERYERTLSRLCATPEQMRQMVVDDLADSGYAWSTKSFEEYPVIRWDDGRLTILGPGLVLRRATGMWPLFEILRVLELERPDPSLRSKVKQALDLAYEQFARETLAGITGQARLYSEDVLRSAYGIKKKVADAAADYGYAWVVVDITTTGFKLPTAAGNNAESVARDLDHVVEKARQIQATIDGLRADETKLTKAAIFPGRRTFYPVLVIATRFATSPITMTILRERLAETRVLQDDDIAPLEVMELEDLLALEGAVERHGLDMAGVLARKATASMALMSMRHFLGEELGHSAPHPARVEDQWQTWFESALEQLRRNAA